MLVSPHENGVVNLFSPPLYMRGSPQPSPILYLFLLLYSVFLRHYYSAASLLHLPPRRRHLLRPGGGHPLNRLQGLGQVRAWCIVNCSPLWAWTGACVGRRVLHLHMPYTKPACYSQSTDILRFMVTSASVYILANATNVCRSQIARTSSDVGARYACDAEIAPLIFSSPPIWVALHAHNHSCIP